MLVFIDGAGQLLQAAALPFMPLVGKWNPAEEQRAEDVAQQFHLRTGFRLFDGRLMPVRRGDRSQCHGRCIVGRKTSGVKHKLGRVQGFLALAGIDVKKLNGTSDRAMSRDSFFFVSEPVGKTFRDFDSVPQFLAVQQRPHAAATGAAEKPQLPLRRRQASQVFHAFQVGSSAPNTLVHIASVIPGRWAVDVSCNPNDVGKNSSWQLNGSFQPPTKRRLSAAVTIYRPRNSSACSKHLAISACRTPSISRLGIAANCASAIFFPMQTAMRSRWRSKKGGAKRGSLRKRGQASKAPAIAAGTTVSLGTRRMRSVTPGFSSCIFPSQVRSPSGKISTARPSVSIFSTASRPALPIPSLSIRTV